MVKEKRGAEEASVRYMMAFFLYILYTNLGVLGFLLMDIACRSCILRS